MKLFIILLLALIFQSCSSVLPYRSYSNEMVDEERGFFTPDEDFHVVPGDKEEAHASIREIIRRTPASAQERESLSRHNALENELEALEESQSTTDYYHYLEYKDRLGTVSDKIYFLRLSSISERNDYLYSKGHYQINAPGYKDISEAVGNRDIVVGMNKEDVTASWGRPARVDVDGNPSLGNERWTFYDEGKMNHVYFENGMVQGWDIDQ